MGGPTVFSLFSIFAFADKNIEIQPLFILVRFAFLSQWLLFQFITIANICYFVEIITVISVNLTYYL